jgi:hypothetical protein
MNLKTTTPFLLTILLSGCFSSPHGVSVGVEGIQPLLDTVMYQKDTRTGLCFGVTSSSSVNVNGTGSAGIIIINVPCESVEKFLGQKTPAEEKAERRVKPGKV